jgi:hypothetical protein
MPGMCSLSWVWQLCALHVFVWGGGGRGGEWWWWWTTGRQAGTSVGVKTESRPSTIICAGLSCAGTWLALWWQLAVQGRCHPKASHVPAQGSSAQMKTCTQRYTTRMVLVLNPACVYVVS